MTRGSVTILIASLAGLFALPALAAVDSVESDGSDLYIAHSGGAAHISETSNCSAPIPVAPI